MTPRLLEILGCPYDRSALDVTFEDGSDAGLLCPVCKRGYPVIRGIPRALPDELWTEVLREETAYFGKHRSWWEALPNARAGTVPEASGDAETARRTMRSFGYQWTRFLDEPDRELAGDFAEYLHPLGEADFRGRLVLDAGCGNGRFLRMARVRGAEVVGLDLSAAVGSAAALLEGYPGAHVIQGSLLMPPLRVPFDLVYSIGVLHHLPKGAGPGVESLSRLLKPAGRLAIWVYSTRRVEETRLRRIAARMPLPLLRAASLALACWLWLRDILPYRLRKAFRGEAHAQARLRGWGVYHAYRFHVLWTDLFDMLAPPVEFQYDDAQIRRWMEGSGLAVEHLAHIDAFQGWRCTGRKGQG